MNFKNFKKSKNRKEWVAQLSAVTCNNCKKKHGTIFPIDLITDISPLHPNCRCRLKIMNAILAGGATSIGNNGADWYIAHKGRLPKYYYTKEEAKICGWEKRKNTLDEVLPGIMLGGNRYYNKDGKLPKKEGRIWFEADIDYINGYRNTERLLYSNDGLIFVTYDHYNTFYEIITEE